MNKILGQVEILNLHTGKAEDAFLHDGISDRLLKDFEDKWRPVLIQKENEIRAQNTANGNIDAESYLTELGDFGIQDWHWDWRKKRSLVQGELIYKTYALECKNTLQGLMLVNLGKLCQLSSQKNRPLVYIEFLTVAPWNRSQLYTNPSYKYIGNVLIAVAISLSLEEEYMGRIGLHSLPQAAGFYEDKVGMKNLGPDKSHKDLNYYEMTPEQAKLFLNP